MKLLRMLPIVHPACNNNHTLSYLLSVFFEAQLFLARDIEQVVSRRPHTKAFMYRLWLEQLPVFRSVCMPVHGAQECGCRGTTVFLASVRPLT